ncbi:MAG: L-threonylcarbamoyladenylate synthase [Chitinophagales bacterium]
MLISVDKAVELLQHAEAVAVPTETVYGLAAVATNAKAISRIFEIKNRPADNPLICHFCDIEQIKTFATSIPENTLRLLQHFSPGPISFMLDLPQDSSLLFATCGNPQMIARIPDHPLFLSIIKKLNVPVAAPSANTSGRISATTAEMVEKDLGDKISGIVDGGATAVGLESTIVDARSMEKVFVLRPGLIGEKEIKSVLRDVKVIFDQDDSGKNIPGAKYPHYAPKTPVKILTSVVDIIDHPDSAVFLTLESMQTIPRSIFPILTSKNIHLLEIGTLQDLNSIARNFYQVVSSVDQLELSQAYFLMTDFGDSSLGKTLQNRLQKIVTG